MGLKQAMRDSFGGPRKKSAVVHPDGGYYGYRGAVPLNGERNYSFDVGSGENSSLIQAVVGYYSRTYPEAPIQLTTGDGEKIIKSHPFLSLLRRPNDNYSGVVLSMVTMMSWICDGNAYWRKVRSASGKPIQLWYVPHWLIEPKWNRDNSDEYVGWYEYTPGGGSGSMRLPVEDVVHFRNGLDPHNTRKGYSWVKVLLREIYTDEEASRFVAAMLRNMGIVGLVISPKERDDSLSEDEANAMKVLVKQRTTGDQRGDPIVSETPIDVLEMGKTADKIDTSRLAAIPESRISALSGIPAAVLGFLSGMQQTAVGATLDSLRELAYESALIPTQRIMAADMWLQLLSDFVDDIESWEVGYDYTQVRVLQEDMDKKWSRVTNALKESVIMRSEARKELGFTSEPNEDVYIRRGNYIETRREDVGSEQVQEEEEEEEDTTTDLRVVV